MPVKSLPSARRLREFLGQTIEISPAPLKQILGADGRTSQIATLTDGTPIWVPKAVKFDGEHSGIYDVVEFNLKTPAIRKDGTVVTTGVTLRNHREH